MANSPNVTKAEPVPADLAPPVRPDDADWMRGALALARRAMGVAAENPAVGCIIVKDGVAVGRGWTQRGGRPHAETVALAQAGDAARGATVYVTLEPCAHHGKTPPCTNALIAAGVARVVVGTGDPDARVDGKGIGQLRAAGIPVTLPCLESACQAMVAGFVSRQRDNRPFVTLKLATSLDGRIATAPGASQWITGALARQRGHLLRAQVNAVMIGSGTALVDDPLLTVRLPGLEDRAPVRVVVDSRLRLSPRSQLVHTLAQGPVWVVTRADSEQQRRAGLESEGVRLIDVPGRPEGGVDLPWALAALAQSGVNRVLVEGGAQLAGALIRDGLVDELILFRAGLAIGGDGLAALAPIAVLHPDAAPRFVLKDSERLGADVMEVWHPQR